MKTELLEFSDQAQMSLVEKIYKNRGFNSASDWRHYLDVTKEDIPDPLLLKNMENGVKMLISHIQKGHKIMVQIDSDCDGFTSAAVLLNYLNCLFPSYVQNNIFYRPHTEKQHGIIFDTVPSDVKLVIAPDSSSNDYDVHQQLQERGIDVLVLDHHNAPEGESKYACVINNQLCDYPTKSLSGVGIVYKFCSYIDKLLGQNFANNYLDLVALGMIADVMELKDYETRYLINQGMLNIKNPFFKGLCAKDTYHFSPGIPVTPKAIAWNIAPAVNAVARMGSFDEKLLLFESMLEHKAYNSIPSTKRGHKGEYETVVEQACRNCTNIRNKQNRARDASLEIIERLIKEESLLENQILVIKMDKKKLVDKNITGLIANKLISYNKPILILNEIVDDENQQILWSGSARNPGSKGFNDFQSFIKDSGFAEFAEGHSNAFGVQFTDDNLTKFIEYSNEKLKTFDFTPAIPIDAVLYANLIDDYYADLVELCDLDYIWGKGVEEPIVYIKDLKITTNINLYGSTLKIAFPSSDEGLSLIKYKSSNEEYESLYSELGCVTINAVGRIEPNRGWDGKPQIIIEDYEIVEKQEYYF